MELVKNGVAYLLPAGLTSVDGLGISFRNKQEDRAFSHGAVEVGDGKAEKKTVTIDVHIFGESIADHDYQYDTLLAALSRRDQQLFIRPDRYINLSRLDQVTKKSIKGFQFIRSQVTATMIAVDPFWYSSSPTVMSQTITASPTSITVLNPGTVDTPLKISVAAAADCSAVTVTNTTDSNRSFSLSDVQLIDGVTETVDAVAGTVYRGTSNAINVFSGAFLSLLPGDNTLTYTGGNCTLTLEFTPRWL